MWILACCQVSRLVPDSPYKSPVNINEVNHWDETVWIWKGICPVCHVYAHSAWRMPSFPFGCTGSWFVLWWWGVFCCSVLVGAPVWGALSLTWVVLSLCSHVLAPTDVISSRCVVSDQSSGSMHAWVHILSNCWIRYHLGCLSYVIWYFVGVHSMYF